MSGGSRKEKKGSGGGSLPAALASEAPAPGSAPQAIILRCEQCGSPGIVLHGGRSQDVVRCAGCGVDDGR